MDNDEKQPARQLERRRKEHDVRHERDGASVSTLTVMIVHRCCRAIAGR
jgi:hypothetical protein